MIRCEWDWRLLDPDVFPSDILRDASERKSLPPVIIFYGKAGIGKKMFAQLAGALSVCRSASACGSCSECHSALRGGHPEIKIFEGPQRFTTDEASALQDHISTLPQSTRAYRAHRVAILFDAERMTGAAANALLKTLEEPHEYAKIFLTTSSLKDLPQTIISRCSQIRVPPPEPKTARRIARNLSQKTHEDTTLDSQLAACGYAPWKWVEVHEGTSNDYEIAEQIYKYLLSVKKDTPQAVRFCEQHLKSHSVETVIRAVELAFNLYYKNILETDKRDSVKITALKRRRQLLSQLWKKAGRQKIHLNSQLAAETILIQ